MNKIKEWLMYFAINQILKMGEVIKMLTKVKDLLVGKKTYIVALSAIIGVVIGWTNGSMDDMAAIKAIIEAILAMTIRSGIDTSKPA